MRANITLSTFPLEYNPTGYQTIPMTTLMVQSIMSVT